MSRKIAFALATFLCIMPLAATAETIPADQLPRVGLYLQLIQLLQKEIALMHTPPAPSLTIFDTYGAAPHVSLFTVDHTTGTEVISFGDGHYTNEKGCVMSAKGWCEVSGPVAHTYGAPGTYTVGLYTMVGGEHQKVSTNIVVVTAPNAE